MAYLVTGGAGFIGSHLVDALLDEGQRVIVIDDFSFGKEENLANHKNNKNLLIWRKNICDDLTGVFKEKKIKVVFHLAALSRVQFSIQNPRETHNVNVNGTLNLLSMCEKFKVKRIIFASSSSIYGDREGTPLREDMVANPTSPYALQKLIGEEYCRLFHTLYGLETISLRYFNVFGPRQDPEGDYGFLIPKFSTLINKNMRPPINGDGKQTRDFVYISDTVEATVAAANSENENCLGQTFNIGSGKNISVNEVTKRIIKLSTKSIEPMYGPPVREPKQTLADISKIKDLLGWEPEISFDEGLKKTYEYFST